MKPHLTITVDWVDNCLEVTLRQSDRAPGEPCDCERPGFDGDDVAGIKKLLGGHVGFHDAGIHGNRMLSSICRRYFQRIRYSRSRCLGVMPSKSFASRAKRLSDEPGRKVTRPSAAIISRSTGSNGQRSPIKQPEPTPRTQPAANPSPPAPHTPGTHPPDDPEHAPNADAHAGTTTGEGDQRGSSRLRRQLTLSTSPVLKVWIGPTIRNHRRRNPRRPTTNKPPLIPTRIRLQQQKHQPKHQQRNPKHRNPPVDVHCRGGFAAEHGHTVRLGRPGATKPRQGGTSPAQPQV